MKTFLNFVAIVIVTLSLHTVMAAQSYSYKFRTEFEPVMVTEPPDFYKGFFKVIIPDEAEKQGVEGRVIISCVLGIEGTVTDIYVIEGLPYGVTEAVKTGLQNWKFKPAKNKDQPVAMKMTVTYTISAIYEEFDSEVSKPKIIQKPVPTYPEKLRPEKHKGKVDVNVQFNMDGTVEVMGVNSTMPKEFDTAAKEAAKGIKFEPAIHKKSKKPVTQRITVSFDFKP